MQVATTSPQTLWRLVEVGLDMAKVLAVVAMRKAILSSVYLSLDDNMVKAIQLEYHLRVYVSL
jgi:hypothetical protein